MKSENKRQLDVIFEPLIASPAMKKIDESLRAVAAKEVTLTFIGESGVGKDVLARRAHQLSKRRSGPFIPINCAAIPEALFETELFGHERGAFTGASERSKGKIEAARGGTLLLDEIGEMPMPMQAKLLRFLESHRYMRVGGTTKIEADVRLMFATLRPLEQEVQAGRFRGDLFYRIQGVTMLVPPLRDRRADIPALLKLFVSQLSSKHGLEPPRLSRIAKAALTQYSWPGNVRELRNVIETLCLLRDGRQVRLRHLPDNVRAGASSVKPEATRDSDRLTLELTDGLEALVRQIIEAALQRNEGSPVAAAACLGISPRTVQRYIAVGRVSAPGGRRGKRRASARARDPSG